MSITDFTFSENVTSACAIEIHGLPVFFASVLLFLMLLTV